MLKKGLQDYVSYDKKLKTTLKQMPSLDKIHNVNLPGPTEVATYTVEGYAFLEEYKKDLDAKRVIKELGIPKKKYEQWLDDPKFTDVMNRIHNAYADAVLMDSKTIAGWSVEILRDLHTAFKAGDTKTGSSLAAMAGNMLKASGNFVEQSGPSTQVNIQINTNLPTGHTAEEGTDDFSINIKSEKNE